MGLQVIQDSDGNNTGVFISYDEWKEIKAHHKDLEALENDGLGSEDTLSNIKNGFEEMQLLKKGKLKTTSAKDFLNEL